MGGRCGSSRQLGITPARRFWCRRNGSCRGRSTPNSAPATFAPVRADGLDAMQLEAASVVAGQDRLVLIVGPAGAGKTMMLSTAAQNLGVQDRDVFGLAPTAKAARKLETETGIGTDTVAKLLYEWTRPDRPPEPRWCLPAGYDGDRRRSRDARNRATCTP